MLLAQRRTAQNQQGAGRDTNCLIHRGSVLGRDRMHIPVGSQLQGLLSDVILQNDKDRILCEANTLTQFDWSAPSPRLADNSTRPRRPIQTHTQVDNWSISVEALAPWADTPRRVWTEPQPPTPSNSPNGAFPNAKFRRGFPFSLHNPSTPKSHQFHISPAASSEI